MKQMNLWGDERIDEIRELPETIPTPATKTKPPKRPKIVTLQMINWDDGTRFEKTLPVVAQVGQLVIGKDLQLHIVHPGSGLTIVSIPPRIGKLADVKALAQAMCDAVDIDAYWQSPDKDPSVGKRLFAIFEDWTKKQGGRLGKDDYNCFIRQAKPDDLIAIQRIAPHIQHLNAALVADDASSLVGVCLYSICEDGSEIHEIIVDERYRQRRIGCKLLFAVPNLVRARCPVESVLNAFYKRWGFRLLGQHDDQNIWLPPA